MLEATETRSGRDNFVDDRDWCPGEVDAEIALFHVEHRVHHREVQVAQRPLIQGDVLVGLQLAASAADEHGRQTITSPLPLTS